MGLRSPYYSRVLSSVDALYHGRRLLQWPGNRVQAPITSSDGTLGAGHVLEIPRQLKYQRKRKHESIAAVHAIQVRLFTPFGVRQCLKLSQRMKACTNASPSAFHAL